MKAPVVQARTTRHRLLAAALAGTLVCAAVTGCSATSGSATPASSAASPATSGSGIDTSSVTSIFDSSTVQSISVDVDPDAYQAMVDTYIASGEKEWISATVTINGTVFSNVGIKLKGNSSLMGLRGEGPGSTAAADTTTTTTAAADTTTTAAADAATAADTAIAPSTAEPAPDTVRGGPSGSVSTDDPAGLPWRIRLVGSPGTELEFAL